MQMQLRTEAGARGGEELGLEQRASADRTPSLGGPLPLSASVFSEDKGIRMLVLLISRAGQMENFFSKLLRWNLPWSESLLMAGI